MKFRTHKRGFTLIELLFIIVIMGIIAAVAIPRMTTTSETAKNTANAHNISVINTQVERWHLEKGTFPATDLSDIGTDSNYFPEGLPDTPFDNGTVYQLDENHRTVTVIPDGE